MFETSSLVLDNDTLASIDHYSLLRNGRSFGNRQVTDGELVVGVSTFEIIFPELFAETGEIVFRFQKAIFDPMLTLY